MANTGNYISQMSFKIDGAAPSDLLKRLVREISVDTSLNLPDMFSIHFDDPSLTCIDSPDLAIGKQIEISAQAMGENSYTPLIKGEIVAIEPELTQDCGMTVVVRGYDKSHRLHRGKKCKTFVNKTDSDIVKEVAQGCGLTVDADATNVVNEHVFQDNLTDMEFIHERARRAGYFSYIDNGKVYFKKPSSGSATATLEWGNNLIEFQARLSSAGQVNSAQVRGWDVKNKTAIVGSKATPAATPSVAGFNHGGQAAGSAFGLSNVTEVVHNRPVNSQSEAEMLAQSELNESCQTFFQAEGKCWGNAAVRAGRPVGITGIGQRFSGNYLITRAVHTLDFYGYTTRFEVSGLRTNTLSEILNGHAKENVFGVVSAIVTDVKDPDGMARVKVKYPTISDQLSSHWARLVSPMAGPQRGIQFIPELNDEVLIAFEYNDINKPYVLGSLWNGKDAPPETSQALFGDSGQVQKRIIKTRSGHIITFDDTAQNEQISIIDKSGQKIIMDSAAGKEKIEVIDKTGKSKISLDAAHQSVAIESAMDLSIKATGKIKIDAQTGITINTVGGNLEMKSNAQTKINGTQTSVEGTAMAEVKSGGGGKVSITGPMVMIN